MPAHRPLLELAALFLRLGATAFGGPAAHVALMEDEVVRRRRWLTPEEFLDLLGAANLIPGPNSTELAIHVGHRRAGWPGLLVAGVCFILPASLVVTLLAWAYVRHGRLPAVQGVLYGVKPVVIAIVAQALWRLGRSAVATPALAALALAAAAAAALGAHELLVLAGAALVAGTAGTGRPPSPPLRDAPADPPAGDAAGGSAAGRVGAPAVALAALAAPVAASTLGTLFLAMAKTGAVLFGSGYVLLAFLRADFVERLGWLTERQLLDAVAVGQVTPGPLFTTATFVGYLVGGPAGALVATVGIFLPAFVFVAASGPLVPRLRRSRVAGRLLDGVNVASLALMAVVTARLARDAVVDAPTLLLALAAALLLRWRPNGAWLILGGAAAGLLLAGG
jgi:chromate transporter